MVNFKKVLKLIFNQDWNSGLADAIIIYTTTRYQYALYKVYLFEKTNKLIASEY